MSTRPALPSPELAVQLQAAPEPHSCFSLHAPGLDGKARAGTSGAKYVPREGAQPSCPPARPPATLLASLLSAVLLPSLAALCSAALPARRLVEQALESDNLALADALYAQQLRLHEEYDPESEHFAMLGYQAGTLQVGRYTPRYLAGPALGDSLQLMSGGGKLSD